MLSPNEKSTEYQDNTLLVPGYESLSLCKDFEVDASATYSSALWLASRNGC